MTIYCLNYENYNILLRTEEKVIEVYRGGDRIMTNILPSVADSDSLKKSSDEFNIINENSDLAKKIIGFLDLK